MIDFRYHLVSIVAVFLALATGIVIGATSLQGEVAGTLQGQVTQLRQDKQQLRSQVEQGERAAGRADQYVGDVQPKALAGQLKSRTVAIVALPGTSTTLVRAMQTSIEQAGGTVTSTARLTESWVTGKDATRTTQLRTTARSQGLAADVPENRLAGLVLAQALSVDGEQVPGQSPGLQSLVDQDYLEVSPQYANRAQSVVVVWPNMAPGDQQDATVSRWSDLITGLGLSGRPVVGVGSGSQRAGEILPDALMAQLRDSAQVTGAMSTVDDGGRAIGRAATVLALRDRFAGRTGNYGLNDDASAVAPALTPAAQ